MTLIWPSDSMRAERTFAKSSTPLSLNWACNSSIEMNSRRRLRWWTWPLRTSQSAGGSTMRRTALEWNDAQSRNQFQPTIVLTRMAPSVIVS